ncbi:DNA-binding FadR family transcriptional regulator [Pedobacter cryoconitis]|uniref:FadR/GntR family transcriptional regulator n=1 Tax=Pedobacter cryoconitis TaxID=188932 RepID=UPI00161294FE|nr:FadR/GntR family transcriptional regulator [Pedobacter cryoconitis]MBB6270146.1 DNA-binding FadR family transcriptional regulator [Pedobacter cryoconitis]
MKLYEKVIGLIKEDISQGKYKAGEKIPSEPELMKLYDVGRSSIREAIKTLAISGILKVQQGSGTFVNQSFQEVSIEQRLRRADFDDVNAVRGLLEKEIVKLATQNRTEEQLGEMERCLENRKLAIQDEDALLCADADIAFHTAIALACSNPVLSDLYYSFTLIMRNFFQAREKQGISRFAMNHHLHEQLFKAIKSKKTNQSQSVLQKILDNNY